MTCSWAEWVRLQGLTTEAAEPCVVVWHTAEGPTLVTYGTLAVELFDLPPGGLVVTSVELFA